MGQPVKLSDELILDARLISKVTDRSIAGQIEHWAGLGRAIEPLLRGDQSLALRRAGATMPLSECVAAAETPAGRKKLHAYLKSLPYPHYEPAPNAPGLLIRTDASGKRTVGRFVRREFQVVKTLPRR